MKIMNLDERIQLIKKIQKGEQNRYGEIEYELSDKERLAGLKTILDSTKSFPLSASDSKSIESILYWNLCSNITVVHETCKLVEKYSHIKSVRKGFLEALGDMYTFTSRIRHLENIISYFRQLNLKFSKEFKSDIRSITDKWQDHKEWIQYSSQVENLLNDL
jgi:hypothetical protein